MRHEAAAVIMGLFTLAGASQPGCTQGPPAHSRAAILEIAADTVRLKLLDAVTTLAIANTDVEIRSDNGMRCIRAPCPNDARRWNGRTDEEGSVMAPVDALQVVTSIRTPGHHADLIEDSSEAADGAWVVEMLPRNAPAELEFHPLDFKLIDKASRRPIADTPVRIAFGGTGGFEGTTNSLGYVFVPVEALLGDAADSSPARDAEPEFARIIVAGYHTAQTDLARANRKVLMERRRD
jgi:hypothetical protein